MMSNDTDDALQQARQAALDDKLNRREFEYNGQTYVLREMTVAEYTDFTQISGDDARDFVPFWLPMLQLPDGRQVFEEEHVESLLELPSSGSIVGKVQHHFLRVNGFVSDDDGPGINDDRLRALALEADDAEDLGARVRELFGVDDEPEDAALGEAVREMLALEDEGDEGKSDGSESG